jgi:hypothetical protein
MSSASNHAKRSHRSERRKQAAFNDSTRRVLITPPYKAKRVNVFKRMADLLTVRHKEAQS